MRVRHPLSFWFMIVVMVLTSSVAVAWSMTHILILLIDIGMIAGLRELAHWEGHRTHHASRDA